MSDIVLPNKNQTGANEWSDVEGNDQAIIDVVNGDLDNGNIATAAAIAGSKLADAGVTSRKVALTAGVVRCSPDLALTTSYQDVPDAQLSITPSTPSKLLVLAAFDFFIPGGAGATTCVGSVKLDSSPEEANQALLEVPSSASDQRATVFQTYVLTLTAAAHTINLRAKRLSGAAKAMDIHTGFLYALIAS